MLLGWLLTITSHPLGACHSYPLAVFVTTYPVVAVPHGLKYLFSTDDTLVTILEELYRIAQSSLALVDSCSAWISLFIPS